MKNKNEWTPRTTFLACLTGFLGIVLLGVASPAQEQGVVSTYLLRTAESTELCSDSCAEAWVGDGYCDSGCYSEACEWDGGDCDGYDLDEDDGDYCAESCPDSWIGDGYCDASCFNAACGWDYEDCGVEEEDACAEGCPPNWIGDDFCDSACNVEACGYDAGDCDDTGDDTDDETYCSEYCPASYLGDGYCDATCFNEACGWDAGDCEVEVGCAEGCPPSWLADGYCDSACNVEACGYDEGDCDEADSDTDGADSVEADVDSYFSQDLFADPGYTDVDGTHELFYPIAYVSNLGVFGGYPDGSFGPDNAINRVETAKVVLNFFEYEVMEDPDTDLGFSDVGVGEWYMPYVYTAVEEGVLAGDPGGTMRPADNVNMAEALKIILEAGGDSVEECSEDLYADVLATDWYCPYVQYAVDNYLVDTPEGDYFYPSECATRGQIAELFYNYGFMFDLYKSKDLQKAQALLKR